ncbi:MAG: GDSL-type esterase/lipase family protein [Limisphaerales bacterium]
MKNEEGTIKKCKWFRAAAISLFVCVVFGAIELPAQTQSNSSRWEPEIRAFENRDRTNPPPQHAVLFIGSSAIRKWKALAEDFPGVTVINRGFGGSEIHDSTYFADRIIFPYHPRTIVFFAGANDLAAGMSPDEVVAEYKKFVATVHAKLPGAPIIYISIDPSPVRWKNKHNIMETNRRIAAMKGDHLEFVDILSPMLDASGNPREDLFLKDRLHPNEQGYQIWAARIKPLLNSDKN